MPVTQVAVTGLDGTGTAVQFRGDRNDDQTLALRTSLEVGGAAVSQALPVPVMNSGALVSSAALEGSHVFSQAPTHLYNLSATGLSAFAWLLLFDAIAIPADGTVAPIAAILLPLAGGSISFGGAAVTLQNGLVAVLSTTGPFLKTSGPTGFLSALTR